MEAAALGLRVDGVDNIDRASSSLGRLADSAKNAETASGQLDRASRSSSKSLSEVTRESDRASRSMGALASAIKPVAASLAAAFSVRALTQYADTWSDMTSLVRVNIGAHEDAAEVMGRLADIARGTYSSMELTAQSFARNAFTLNALGKSTKQQLDYTQALNNALVVSGAKGHAAELVQNALSRAMAEGTLKGEDLNLVLNYGSRVASLLAEQLGVNVTELRNLAKEGKITGDVIFQSVVAGMEAVTKEAESMPATISDGFLLLRNSVLQAVGVFDQANGISEKFAERLVKIADAIREVDLEPVIAATTVLASVIGARLASSALASAAAFSAAQIEAIRYQAALASMAGVSRTTAVGLTAMSAAARTATAAMALVGGPAGAIMLAAGALVYFATRTSEAEKAQQEYNAALDAADRYMTAARSGSTELAAKYREEADAALDAARETLELERARVQAAIAAASVASNDPLDRFAAGMAGMTDSQAERKRQEALAGWEARLARIDERLAAIAEKEVKVGQTAVAEGAGGAGGAADAGTVEQFEKLEASLARQLALYGQTTELAKLRYEMEHGSLQGLNDAQQKRLEDLAKELDAKAALAEKERQAALIKESVLTVDQKLNNQLALLDDLLEAGLLTWDEYSRAAAGAANALDQIPDKTDRIRDRLKQIEMAVHGFGRKFEDALIDAAKGGQDAFRNMTEAILEDIARLVIRMQAIQPLASSINAGISGFFGGANADGNAFQGGRVIPFARGGVVDGPTLFPMFGGKTGLMGEAGPEAIMPLKRMPDGKLGVVAQGGGGVHISIYQTIDARGQGEQAANNIRNSSREMADMIINTVVTDIRRRGAIPSALGAK